MKDLIEQIRTGAFRTNPEIIAVTDALEQQAAVIEQMREALSYYKDAVCAGYNSGGGYYELESDGCVANKALALQPCPEVLNKVKADAVARFAKYADDYEVDKLSAVYIQRLLKGEV